MTTINQLVIRDPDYENSYITDAEINTITIDIGGQWDSYKAFCRDLRAGEADDYEQSILDEVKHLPADNPVREAAEQFFADARTVVGLALSLSDYFKRDNPRFDRVRFLKACGLSKADAPVSLADTCHACGAALYRNRPEHDPSESIEPVCMECGAVNS